MKSLFRCMLMLGSLISAAAGQGVLSFHLERTGLPVSVYTFHIRQDGTGTYLAHSVAPRSANRYAMTVPTEPIDSTQALALNEMAAHRLFDLVRETHGLHACASKMKNIADTGAKTLIYNEIDGKTESFTCSYNYSENKAVSELTNLLQEMAFVLDEARKLEVEQRFDRLGLDAEIQILTTAAKEGRAFGLSNIAVTLQSLVEDVQVLERVRAQAGKLLEQSRVTP